MYVRFRYSEKIWRGLRFFGVFLCGFAVFGPPNASLLLTISPPTMNYRLAWYPTHLRNLQCTNPRLIIFFKSSSEHSRIAKVKILGKGLHPPNLRAVAVLWKRPVPFLIFLICVCDSVFFYSAKWRELLVRASREKSMDWMLLKALQCSDSRIPRARDQVNADWALTSV